VCAGPNDDLVRTPADQCVDAPGLLSDDGPDGCPTNYLDLKGAELGDRDAPSLATLAILTTAIGALWIALASSMF
jgi:hypothetical protein